EALKAVFPGFPTPLPPRRVRFCAELQRNPPVPLSCPDVRRRAPARGWTRLSSREVLPRPSCRHEGAIGPGRVAVWPFPDARGQAILPGWLELVGNEFLLPATCRRHDTLRPERKDCPRSPDDWAQPSARKSPKSAEPPPPRQCGGPG